MIHHSIPRRSRDVRVNELGGELTMRIVANIGQTADTPTLRKLISGDQLAVSVDGQSSAHIVTFRRGAEVVVHSELGVIKPRFERLLPDLGTRILQVESDSLLVWGKVHGYPPGLWYIDTDGARFFLRLDRLLRGNNSASKSIKGVSADRLGEVIHLAPWGWWSTDAAAHVSHDNDGLCIMETIAGHPYVYRVSEEGISRFALLNLEASERVVEVITWQGRLMVAVRRGSQSWLVSHNRESQGEIPARIQIDGNLHGVWASLTGKTLAMLVHPRGHPEDYRRLQLDNGQIIHEGRFHIDSMSIVWSPGENAFAVKIREGEGVDGVLHERIVGTNVAIAAGLHLREFLIDDNGRIAAAIQSDGIYDLPIIGGRAGTQVPLAWNLHYTPEGQISWTTIHDDRILTWTQQRR